MRGLGNSADSFADSMEKAQAAKAAEERSIELMNFNLMDAQRKERSGNAKGAMEATAKAEKNKLDAVAAERAALQAQGVIEARVAQSLRQTKGAGAGAGGKEFIAGPAAYLGEVKEEYPQWTPAKQQAEAFRRYQQGKAAGYQGAKEKTDVAAEALELKRQQFEAEELRKTKIEPDYKDGTPEKKKEMEAAARARATKRAQQEVTVLKAKGGIISPIKLD
jgi:hypothetical protein